MVLTLQACSKEQVKRAGYETLQNMGELQCERELSADCTDQESHEDYDDKYRKVE